jgi:hypothetical protein
MAPLRARRRSSVVLHVQGCHGSNKVSSTPTSRICNIAENETAERQHFGQSALVIERDIMIPAALDVHD